MIIDGLGKDLYEAKAHGKVIRIPDEDRERIWSTVMNKSVELSEKLGTEGNLEAAGLLVKEIQGGSCDVCKKPYKKVVVDNPFVKGEYWEPSCPCEVSCPRCLRRLGFDRAVGNIKRVVIGDESLVLCPNCGWRLVIEKKGYPAHSRTGKKWEEMEPKPAW